MVPEDLKYTEGHTWVMKLSDSRVRVGLTDYAQSHLGDIEAVKLPQVGDSFGAGQALGEVESTKAVSDIEAPLAGEVAAVNDGVGQDPGTIHSDCYGDGWLVEINMTDTSALEGLLDAAKYTDIIHAG